MERWSSFWPTVAPLLPPKRSNVSGTSSRAPARSRSSAGMRRSISAIRRRRKRCTPSAAHTIVRHRVPPISSGPGCSPNAIERSTPNRPRGLVAVIADHDERRALGRGAAAKRTSGGGEESFGFVGDTDGQSPRGEGFEIAPHHAAIVPTGTGEECLEFLRRLERHGGMFDVETPAVTPAIQAIHPDMITGGCR